MRRIAWVLLLLFAFAIPWEYSMDLGESLGNIARVLGLLLLFAAIPAVLQAGRLRPPGPMLVLVLALYLWFCCTYFWTIEPLATLERLRGYFQEMMIVWLVWELAESAGDLRSLLRAYIAGSWVLAILTVANFVTAQAVAGQIRFVAEGQDPNDVARFLDLAFPLAALLLNSERRWPWRLLAAGYLPLGLLAVLLTASRGGFLAAIVALAGSGLLLARAHPRKVLAATLALPPIAFLLWFIIPHGTFERLATISEQLQGGGLNQRWNIWVPVDTAHNTALSIAVSGGLCALFLAAAIVAAAIWSIKQTHGPLRWALATTLLVWFITSQVDTVEENRVTWLLLALFALAGRLAVDQPVELDACFPAAEPTDGNELVPA